MRSVERPNSPPRQLSSQHRRTWHPRTGCQDCSVVAGPYNSQQVNLFWPSVGPSVAEGLAVSRSEHQGYSTAFKLVSKTKSAAKDLLRRVLILLYANYRSPLRIVPAERCQFRTNKYNMLLSMRCSGITARPTSCSTYSTESLRRQPFRMTTRLRAATNCS